MTQIRLSWSTNGKQERSTTAHNHDEAQIPTPIAMPTPNFQAPTPTAEHADADHGHSCWSDDSDSSDSDSDTEREGEDFSDRWVRGNRSTNQNDVTTSFFAGATNVHISGAATFATIRGDATIVSRAAMRRPKTSNTEGDTAHATSTDNNAVPHDRPMGPRPSGGGNEGTKDRADTHAKDEKKPRNSARHTSRPGRDNKAKINRTVPTQGPGGAAFSFGNGASNFEINGGSFTTVGGNAYGQTYSEGPTMPVMTSTFYGRRNRRGRGPNDLPNTASPGPSATTSGMQSGTSATSSTAANTNTGTRPTESTQQPRSLRERRNRSGNTPGLDHNVFAPYGGDRNGNGASGFAMDGFTMINGVYVVHGTITPLE